MIIPREPYHRKPDKKIEKNAGNHPKARIFLEDSYLRSFKQPPVEDHTWDDQHDRFKLRCNGDRPPKPFRIKIKCQGGYKYDEYARPKGSSQGGSQQKGKKIKEI